MLEVGCFDFGQTLLAYHLLIYFKFTSKSTWSNVLELLESLLLIQIATSANNRPHARRIRITSRLEFLCLIYAIHLILSYHDLLTVTWGHLGLKMLRLQLGFHAGKSINGFISQLLLLFGRWCLAFSFQRKPLVVLCQHIIVVLRSWFFIVIKAHRNVINHIFLSLWLIWAQHGDVLLLFDGTWQSRVGLWINIRCFTDSVGALLIIFLRWRF